VGVVGVCGCVWVFVVGGVGWVGGGLWFVFVGLFWCFGGCFLFFFFWLRPPERHHDSSDLVSAWLREELSWGWASLASAQNAASAGGRGRPKPGTGADRRSRDTFSKLCVSAQCRGQDDMTQAVSTAQGDGNIYYVGTRSLAV